MGSAAGSPTRRRSIAFLVAVAAVPAWLFVSWLFTLTEDVDDRRTKCGREYLDLYGDMPGAMDRETFIDDCLSRD